MSFTIDDAIVLAATAHRGQRDKGCPALPYITHPMRVMSAFPDEELLQIVAILHDTVEDTSLTIEGLRSARVPADAIVAIELLTKPDGADYEAYLERIRTNELALRVKLADVADNADEARLSLLAPDKAQKLREKYARAKEILG